MAEQKSRRDLIRQGATAAGIAGAVWVAPQVLSMDAAHASAGNCTGTIGYFTWARAAYGNLQRSGSPGSNTAMNTASGWTGHPTFTSTAYATATPITVTFKLENTTYLNSANNNQGHGVSTPGTSATFKSYRVSKTGAANNAGPPAGDVLTIVMQFSALVGCPTFVIGDLDNQLPSASGTTPGCTGALAAAAPYWADGLSVTGYTALNGGGATVATTRVAGTGGTNVSPAVGAAGPWYANACQSIAQSANDSNLAIRASGAVRELRIQYISRYHDASGVGSQHIALGDLQFYY